MSASYLVQPGDPRRIARAVVRYQTTRPQFWAPMAAIVAGMGLLGSYAGGVGAVAGIVLTLVVIAGTVAYRQRQLAPTLAARGFRPGTSIEADFGATALTIAAHGGTGVHEYTAIADARRIDDVVLLRLRQARLVLALPADLVPDARLRGLRQPG